MRALLNRFLKFSDVVLFVWVVGYMAYHPSAGTLLYSLLAACAVAYVWHHEAKSDQTKESDSDDFKA